MALAAGSFRRLIRDRSALFFMVVLPVLVIVIVGSTVTSDQRVRVGVVGSSQSVEGGRILAALRSGNDFDVATFDDAGGARTAMRRGELDTAVIIPAQADEALRSGRRIEVAVLAQPNNQVQQAAGTAVSGALADHGAVVAAARVRAAETGGPVEDQLEEVQRAGVHVDPVEVRNTVVDAEAGVLPGGFSYSAPTMLVLFVFIISITGSATIIESRRLGVHDRALAGPVTPRSLVAGETLSLLLVAAVQSALIIGVGALAFGVDWGDPLAAAALATVWALVGTGAGVLAGTLFGTAEQSGSIGSMVGLVAGMLGGCMWPLEIVPAGLRTVGHAVPHAWAVDGWTEVLARGGGLGSITTELAVLTSFAAVLLGAAWLRLRSRLAA